MISITDLAGDTQLVPGTTKFWMVKLIMVI